MNLFGRRQASVEDRLSALANEVARLASEVGKAQSEVRAYQTEQINMHDQVRKWMRRAIAAERAVERNQDSSAERPAGSTPAPAALPWGARGRRYAAAMRGTSRANGVVENPVETVEGEP